MARMIHAMIRVLDEARSLAFYERAFGLSAVARFEFESFRLIYLRDGESGFELELTVNKGREAPYQLGDGYGHLAFTVEDLEAEHRRMDGLGFSPKPIKTLESGPFQARFFFIADPDGYQIEVLERRGRFG